MNNLQRAKLDTCNRVKEYLTKHDATLLTISELGVEQSAFQLALDAINEAAIVQSQLAAVASDAVKSAKEKMATLTTLYAKRGKVKALQLNNTILANQLDISVSHLTNASKALAVHRATEIKNQLQNNLSILNNITAANIDEITDAIEAFNNLKDKPVTMIQARVATGTNPLPTWFAKAFTAIENMGDLIESHFMLTNKPMVDEFELAKQIINTGIHHTGVQGMITHEGNPAVDATVTLLGTSKKANTDLNGHYVIANVRAGDYVIEASTNDGKKVSETVHLAKGNMENLDLAL